MEYNRIIAITGLGGLFELLSSRGDGAVVRSLEDKQTRFVSSRIHHFSHLESIEVYTVKENVNLVDLFKSMQTSSIPLPPESDADRVKGYFERVYPNMDFTRIYNSDMKKMIKWYNLLINNNIELKLSEPVQPAAGAGNAAGPAQAQSSADTVSTATSKATPSSTKGAGAKSAPASGKATASVPEPASKKKGGPAEVPAKKEVAPPKKDSSKAKESPTPKKDAPKKAAPPAKKDAPKSSGKSGGKSKSK